jgi:DNA-binding beta-propeller fold protein YncE
VSPDGVVLYATDGTSIYVLDAATGAQKQTFPLPVPALYGATMAISPDGTMLFLTGAGSPEFPVVDVIGTATGVVTAVPVPSGPISVAVLPEN